MNRVTALVGITVLAVLAGCAKKEAPQAQAQAQVPAQAQPQVQEDDDVATTTATPPAPEAVKPLVKDRSKAAADMVAFIDPSPQCQKYRDQLEALGKVPGPIDDLSPIYVQAHQAGCVIKKQKD
jgi:hypothetical protein